MSTRYMPWDKKTYSGISTKVRYKKSRFRLNQKLFVWKEFAEVNKNNLTVACTVDVGDFTKVAVEVDERCSLLAVYLEAVRD